MRGRCKLRSPSPLSSPIKGEEVNNLTVGEKCTNVLLLPAASPDATRPCRQGQKNVGIGLILSLSLSVFLWSCESEVIRQQEEQIRLQQEEIMRQRRELEELAAARKKEEQERAACNRAFRDFEMAQAAKVPNEAVALYRQGLKLCPDDDVAHYELGKVLQGMGQTQDARQEFEAALKINPGFRDAGRQLEAIQKK